MFGILRVIYGNLWNTTPLQIPTDCPQIHIDPLSSPSTLIGQPPYIPIPLPEIPMDLHRYPETPYRFQCSPLDNYRYLKIP